ncbi:PREDICTED: uncharacterized protein LOC106126447 [Papilio xuthus]|uniref:Uncharacterized protein LOC106126447 n=1 Tax=Papilio xuthus TaxID=66420 RepID=A0AAJ6ZV31_PAPXU|nr:PREDICTED: uncharacterized protein LOC106126447 [Papilio xuthus]
MSVLEKVQRDNDSTFKSSLLLLRLGTLVVLACMLTVHLRSLRLFRWEQSVTGGVVITYCIAVLGLALCAGSTNCRGHAIQAYLCGTGAALLAVNAGVIYRRWKSASQLTHVVAELLGVLGVPLKRQVVIKVSLSAIAATCLLVDLFFAPYFSRDRGLSNSNSS